MEFIQWRWQSARDASREEDEICQHPYNVEQDLLKYNEGIKSKKNNTFCEEKVDKGNDTGAHPDLIKIKDTMPKEIFGEEYVAMYGKIHHDSNLSIYDVSHNKHSFNVQSRQWLNTSKKMPRSCLGPGN